MNARTVAAGWGLVLESLGGRRAGIRRQAGGAPDDDARRPARIAFCLGTAAEENATRSRRGILLIGLLLFAGIPGLLLAEAQVEGTLIESGASHTCAVAPDGTLACWGSGDYGQTTPPAGTYTQVSAGRDHTCAVATDGTLACWGYDGDGQATPPEGTFSQVSAGESHSLDVFAGESHSCAVATDGTLACWGYDGDGQATPPAGTYTQVSASYSHTCAVATDGTLACWGSNSFGKATPPAGTYTQVSASYSHTCAVATDGTLACWGYDDYGQSTPPAGTYSQVSAGAWHSCAVAPDGTLACWGWDDYGQATPPAGTYTQVSAGHSHTCAVTTEGTLACWGEDYSDRHTPPALTYGQAATPPTGTYSQMSAGDSHTCAVATDGTLACWGSDGDDQATPPAGTYSQVSAGYTHTCAVATDGTLACWGEEHWGKATPPAGIYSQVSAGLDHSCALATDGTLACWGRDDYGRATPPAGTYIQLSAGDFHTCAVATDGTIACWGYDGDGQATPPAGTYTQVSAGRDHTCAVATDGTLACWGSDDYGQATPPAGTYNQVSATCAVATDGTLACWGYDGDGQATPPAGTYTQVSAGLYHTCAVRADGFLVCWGTRSAAPELALAPSCCLPAALALLPYEMRFQASGGIPPYSYEVADGSLPPGLTLSADGVLSGTPTADGTYDFTVRATDALPYPLVTEVVYTLEIVDVPTGLDVPIVLGFGSSGRGWLEARSRDGAGDSEWFRVAWPSYNRTNGESRPAWCDLDGDGFPELVIGLGKGGRGWLEVKEGPDGGYAHRTWLQIPWAKYKKVNGETWPACGDLDDDGAHELVIGLGTGGGGWVYLFDDAVHDYAPLDGDGWLQVPWAAYNKANGETRPAVGNLDADGAAEILLGLGSGSYGWAYLMDDEDAGFAPLAGKSSGGGWLSLGWPVYSKANGETWPAVCDLDGDGAGEAVLGAGKGSFGVLRVFDSGAGFAPAAGAPITGGWLQVDWRKYNRTNGETHPACGDLDADGIQELLVGLGFGSYGLIELRDDLAAGLPHLDWWQVAWPRYNRANGLARPTLPW